jgi:3',5'-cyclic AMP phosphodiesterase CpdA
MVTIAHFSDIHVDSGARSAARTTRVVEYLAGLSTPPDVVLLTGDIADHGEEGEYERVRELLPFPVLCCPGNHDARGPYRKVMLDEDPADGPVDRAYEISGILILMCDSSIPGRHDGWLADETLAWAERKLADKPGMPALLAFHHPPVELGLTFPDTIRQFGEERLAALVAKHPQIVALLCGHAHSAAATTFAGRPLLVAPGVVSTSLLPFEGGDVVDLTGPPMIALHLLDQQHHLTTHYRVVPV